uniref:Uncharacterized protein n=1 Tax=Apteryx owenii TaxID=8824 RepID=A0A8B9S4V2_APTOW
MRQLLVLKGCAARRRTCDLVALGLGHLLSAFRGSVWGCSAHCRLWGWSLSCSLYKATSMPLAVSRFPLRVKTQPSSS